MQRYLKRDTVGQHLQSAYRLKVLTLCLDRASGDPDVVFELTAPDADDGSSLAALLTCPCVAIGLPARLDEPHLPESAFTLPADIQAAISSAVNQAHPKGGPVWLKFTTPVGLLPAVPWERLLQPLLHVPVLRLPYHQLSPSAPTRNLDCVVCFSSPMTSDRASTDAFIASFLPQVPLDLVAHTVLHLFGDLNIQTQLHELKARFGDRYDIRVYDPPLETARRRFTPMPGLPVLENPWLLWMRAALGRRKIDAVHFLAHSYVTRDEGAMALAKSPAPRDERWEAGYVGAAELVEFLNQSGAWSVGFTSPPDNPSIVGLRLLQDQVASLRPGPCLLHDMAYPDSEDALGQAYRFIFSPDWHVSAASPAISLYCHPWHALESGAFDETSARILDRVTLVNRVNEELLAQDESGWIASAQRVLEQSATPLCDPAPDDVANVEGRRRGLEFVADSLAKYANELTAEKAPRDELPVAPDANAKTKGST